MNNLISLKDVIEGTNNYYIENYGTNFDVVDIIKLSCMLVQKYGGHLYLGSDPENLGNSFGLINKVNIYFPNGFVLRFDGNDRMYEKGVSHFQSLLFFRERKLKTNNNDIHLITNFDKNNDYVYFEISNIDYDIGKEEEEFYWYNVNSEIAEAPYGFHSLSLSTLESYAEYISNLNPKDFKLSRKPCKNWGIMTDAKKQHLLATFNKKSSNSSIKAILASKATKHKAKFKDSSIGTSNLVLEAKEYLDSDILFNLNQKVVYYEK